MMCKVLDVESQYEGVVTQSEEVGVHEAFIEFRGSKHSTQPVPQSLLLVHYV